MANINGTPGDDVIFGTEQDDRIGGFAGNDILYGRGGNDVMTGAEGNDVLVGGSVSGTGQDAANLMYGGIGDDTYYSDVFLDGVFEEPGAGYDRVATSAGIGLGEDSEVELIEAVNLTSTNAMNIIGSLYANTIVGNNGVNELYGRRGDDRLFGAGGNDILDGGEGTDFLAGGLGDDTYYVTIEDVIEEAAGEGNDRLVAGGSYVLAANAAVETMATANAASNTALDLTGNQFGQAIFGNAGANVLTGLGGNDVLWGLAGDDTLVGGDGDDVLLGGAGVNRLEGGAGSDTYYVDQASDFIVEPVSVGVDRVAATISYTINGDADIELMEALNFNGIEALVLTGNQFGQTIVGNAGANTIDGKGGADNLVGGGGQDLFAFTTAIGNGNIDRIEDYLSSFDRIVLENDVFTGLAPGALPAGALVTGTQAQDADDRIIYNSATGALLFDVDGNGATAAVHFATIGTGLTITPADFLVI